MIVYALIASVDSTAEKEVSKIERTFVMIKPDAVRRGLIGEIIRRIERKGLKIVDMKMLTPTLDLVKQHYAVHSAEPWFMDNCNFVCSGPVVAMIVEGPEAIVLMRKLIGATNPLRSEPGTIRGDFSFSGQQNLVHGSDSPETAATEIAHWFPGTKPV